MASQEKEDASTGPERPSAPAGAETPAERRSFAKLCVIAVAIAIGMAAVAMFLWYSLYVLLLAFAAILVGVMLRGMACWLAQKTRLPDGGALAVVILGLIGFFVVLGVLLAPSISKQFEQLADRLPDSIRKVQERVRQYEVGRRLLGDGAPQANGSQPAQQPPAAGEAPSGKPGEQGQQNAKSGADRASGDAASQPPEPPQPGGDLAAKAIAVTTRPATVGRVVDYGRLVVEGLFTFLLVVIVGIYLAAQPRFYVEGLLKLFPRRERPRLREVMHEVGRTLQWWMLGQLIPMVAIGVLTGLGLWLIGVPMWLPLAILAALLNFIPNFGPIIAAVPALLVALANDPTDALWVAGLYVAAQNVEGYLIMPLVQRRAVEMPPALTIMSQVLLGMLLGAVGVVLAAPLTAAALVLVKMLYVEDTLRTPVQLPSDKHEGKPNADDKTN